MSFKLIDFATWKRKEYYEHYLKIVPCTYSTTVNLDITNLKGFKLYPTILWLLTKTINQIPEFRTALTPEGVGIYSNLLPAYTIFNQDTKQFNTIWTEFNEDYQLFLKAYEHDVKTYGNTTALEPKQNRPYNSFDVSMIPWFTFTSLNLNIYNGGQYLLPIFTLGKYFEENNKRIIPLAIQVHHAVCDGYHVGLFVTTLQKLIDNFE